MVNKHSMEKIFNFSDQTFKIDAEGWYWYLTFYFYYKDFN